MTMSMRELDRLKVIQAVVDGELRATLAMASLSGISAQAQTPKDPTAEHPPGAQDKLRPQAYSAPVGFLYMAPCLSHPLGFQHPELKLDSTHGMRFASQVMRTRLKEKGTGSAGCCLVGSPRAHFADRLRESKMKRTLSLLALAAASATAVAAPVTYDFTGTLTSADFFSRDQSFPSGYFDLDKSLTFNGTQLFDGDPNVVGTITFDPDYQQSSQLPMPITFAFTFEGFTITRTQSLYANGYDGVFPGATGLNIQTEGDLHTTGALDPNRADMYFGSDNNNFTGGWFEFSDVTDAADQVFSGNMKGTIDSLTPVAVPEPSELALMMFGVVTAITMSMRRRGLARSRS